MRTDSGPAPVRKTATVSVAAVTAGRGGGQINSRKAEVDTYSSSVTSSTKANRQKRDKPLPSSFEEMPKLQDKNGKVIEIKDLKSTPLDFH